jgi:hypothetical protein
MYFPDDPLIPLDPVMKSGDGRSRARAAYLEVLTSI